jgi:competence/damage-inducible protein CinA-like protein
MNRVEILSQGDEVLTGQTVDTNAAWLSEQLVLMGFDIVRHSTVGDSIEDIKDALSQASQRCDLVICSGGLGPTQDDLTAEAVALVSGKPLVFDAQALVVMKDMFVRLNRNMVKANEKQVWLPEGVTRIDNFWGTAPGFTLLYKQTLMAFLPGVPSEMKAMFEHGLKPELFKHFDLKPSRLVTFRTTGIGESNLQEKIGKFQHEHVCFSYRAMGREVQIKLRFSPRCKAEELDKHCRYMADVLGDCVFAIEGWGDGPAGNLAEVVAGLLAAKNIKLVCAEGASGGEFIRLLNLSAKGVSPVKKGYFFAEPNDLQEMLCLQGGLVEKLDYFHLAHSLRSVAQADAALIITPFESVKSNEGVSIAKTAQCFLVSGHEQLCINDQMTGSDGYCQHAISYTAFNVLRQWLLKC